VTVGTLLNQEFRALDLVQAAERKLSGAAKTSFTKKCVNDGTAAK
jgi:hypothetical protein